MQISNGLSYKNASIHLCPNGVCFVSLTAQGSGYTSAPTVVFSGGGGSGATATATINKGKVASVTVTAAGLSYTSAPTVSFTGGGGSGAAATATLSSGTYWITDGDLALNNSKGTLDCPLCVAGGAGVTVILTNVSGTTGSMTLDAQANLNLSAPSSGTYAGLAIIQDPNAPANTVTVKANATETLNGLVYFPEAAMEFQGGPDAGAASCLVLVVNTLKFQGNPTLDDSGCASAGLSTLPTVIALVE
jgi:hypothetical protein